ncbi:MAG: thioredoxin family protein [Bacteroidetes bacterium]|nr:thioredoxin family protein [Bacteroidota bacterium]
MKPLIVLLIVSLMGLSFTEKKGYDVGDTATDFKLKNTNGKMVSLADYPNAKGFIIIFDCNTCPVSKAYNSRIIALSKKYTPQNFPVILINPNSPELAKGESFDAMVKHAKEKKYDFPYLYDETQETVRQFGATNTPHVFVLNKTSNGMMVAYIGAIDDNTRNAAKAKNHFVEDAVNSLLAGKEITVTKTKAVGCSVKIKNI